MATVRTMIAAVEDGLLKPAEVCRLLSVSRTWVYAAASEGRIPSIRLGGPEGPLRFVPADIEQWLQEARAVWTPGRGKSGRGG
jgi:excisionase family DNA binding protein